MGEWEWNEGDIAGVEHAQDNFELGGLRGTGKPSSYIYNPSGGIGVGRSAMKVDVGVGLTNGVTVKDQFIRWGSGIPETIAVAHVPGMFSLHLSFVMTWVMEFDLALSLLGYTILENVFFMNGTLFVVRDDPRSLPPLDTIASSSTDRTLPPRRQEWQNITKDEAQTLLGSFGGQFVLLFLHSTVIYILTLS